MSKAGQSLLARVFRGSSRSVFDLAMDRALLDRLATPGVHEKQISHFLGEDGLRFVASEPLFAKPLVILAFTNRSGSTLLAEYMRQSGMFHGLGEFANHDFVKKQMRERRLDTFPGLIKSLAGSAGARQLFGLKASWDQIAMLARWNIPAMFTGIRIVRISRHDMLAQAISYSIAEQTRQWTSTQQASGQDPVFNAHDIDRIIREQQLHDALIRLVAQALGAPSYGVIYEGLCANPTPHMREILAYCGVPRPHWVPEEPKLKKQAGPVNQAFRAAYLELARERMLGSPTTSAEGPGESA